MKLIFHADLDNTLIYSYKREIGRNKICVERYQGRDISYMSRSSWELLRAVREKVTVVPTTTRTQEQYERIDLGIGVPEYALICNGGVLLENGREDRSWYEESMELISGSRGEYERARRLLEADRDRCFELRSIRELFLFTKSGQPEKTLQRLRDALDPARMEAFQNGSKIYAVPAGLDKGTAVRRFRSRMKDSFVIAAGDSGFDVPMLCEADAALMPEELRPAVEKALLQNGASAGTLWEKERTKPGERLFSDRVLEYVRATAFCI
ncbi:MAG: HAD family hydrolase [Eubacteriales bacterium]|nr:HAD family hydrolase [Eubacteriales bacterium]